MPSTRAIHCGLSGCAASLLAVVEGDSIAAIAPDPLGVEGAWGTCSLCPASTSARSDPRRILRPRRREGSAWAEASWDDAIRDIAARLRAIRAQTGPSSIGLYAGAPVATSAATSARVAALGWALGTPHLYSPLAARGGPWLRAAEQVLGHPVPLQHDVGRAHYTLLLGANQEAQGFGPLQHGRRHGADLAHARAAKKAKVAAVDPRRTPLAASADVHLRARPGTELWVLLGLAQQVLANGWWDRQYVDRYCRGADELRAALAAWPVERCAAVAGVDADAIAGVALKLSRAAMATIVKSPQMLNTTHGTLASWAAISLAALTANLLRPGGLYMNAGAVDAAWIPGVLGAGAFSPHRYSGSSLGDAIRRPGHGQVRALLCAEGDPARDEPAGTPAALEALDLLVCLDVADTETTRRAHWVLPTTHAWERARTQVVESSILPARSAQHSPRVVPPPGEARDADAVLAEIYAGLGPALRGSTHGLAARALGTVLARGDLAAWEARVFSLAGAVTRDDVVAAEHGWNGGEVDRAAWKVSTESGRIELLPAEIRAALAELSEPVASAEFPLRLLGSAARDPAVRAFDRPAGEDPGVVLHPSLGFAAGSRVRIASAAGRVEATVRLDEGMEPGTVDLPAGYVADVMSLVPAEAIDPLSGAPGVNGVAVRVEG